MNILIRLCGLDPPRHGEVAKALRDRRLHLLGRNRHDTLPRLLVVVVLLLLRILFRLPLAAAALGLARLRLLPGRS